MHVSKRYLNGLLKVLQTKYADKFQGFTHTRMRSYTEEDSGVTVHTEGGHKVFAPQMVMATNVPLQKASIITKQAYYRTYCIAMRTPKDAFPDILLYDNGDPYIYVRKTAHPSSTHEYLIVGGEDHKVGQESSTGYGKHYQHLEAWARKHYPAVEATEYKWSGQIIEPNDYMAFIGLNTGGTDKVYISTGDSGNGLTHGVIAGKLLTDLILGTPNPWASLYSPSRKPKPRTLLENVSENVNQNLQYARYLKSDVGDIESVPRCSGAVIKGGITKLGKPLAVYKDVSVSADKKNCLLCG